MNSYFFQGWKTYYCTYLLFKLSQMWPVGASSSFLCGLVAWPQPLSLSLSIYLFLEHFINLWCASCSKFILFLFCFSPGMSCLSEAWDSLVGNGIRDQDLSSRCAHCYWCFFVLSFLGSAKKYMHIYTHIHTNA